MSSLYSIVVGIVIVPSLFDGVVQFSWLTDGAPGRSDILRSRESLSAVVV